MKAQTNDIMMPLVMILITFLLAFISYIGCSIQCADIETRTGLETKLEYGYCKAKVKGKWVTYEWRGQYR